MALAEARRNRKGEKHGVFRIERDQFGFLPASVPTASHYFGGERLKPLVTIAV